MVMAVSPEPEHFWAQPTASALMLFLWRLWWLYNLGGGLKCLFSHMNVFGRSFFLKSFLPKCLFQCCLLKNNNPLIIRYKHDNFWIILTHWPNKTLLCLERAFVDLRTVLVRTVLVLPDLRQRLYDPT